MRRRINTRTPITLKFAILLLMLGVGTAQADGLIPSDYRALAGYGKFEDTAQYAFGYRSSAPAWLRADRMEFAVGTLTTSDETEAFASFGPVWRFQLGDGRFFGEYGFSPTLLSGSTFNGRELGGKFHFTSSATIGLTFGRSEQMSLAARWQHTSNGGLDDVNPGLDMLGINFSYRFDGFNAN